MLRESRYGPGVHVRWRTELERDPLVADVRREGAQLDDSAFADRHVLDEPHPVTDPVRSAVLHRLPDRGRPEGFARVDRDGEVLAAAELERVQVGFRRVARLLA